MFYISFILYTFSRLFPHLFPQKLPFVSPFLGFWVNMGKHLGKHLPQNPPKSTYFDLRQISPSFPKPLLNTKDSSISARIPLFMIVEVEGNVWFKWNSFI